MGKILQQNNCFSIKEKSTHFIIWSEGQKQLKPVVTDDISRYQADSAIPLPPNSLEREDEY